LHHNNQTSLGAQVNNVTMLLHFASLFVAVFLQSQAKRQCSPGSRETAERGHDSGGAKRDGAGLQEI